MTELIRYRVQLPHGDEAQFARLGPGWTDIYARPDTTDEVVIDEIFVNDVYRVRGLDLTPTPDTSRTRDGCPDVGKTVIDLGANIGAFSALCLRYGAAFVYAVEPDPDNLALLGLNIEPWRSQVRIINAAVGSSHDRLARVGSHGTAHTHDGTVETESAGTIAQITLADIIDDIDGPIALLKCDVEGAELDLIPACPSDRLARIDKIAMEWHGVHMCPWLGDTTERYGAMMTHLARTHAVNTFGDPAVGGMAFAHSYASTS